MAQPRPDSPAAPAPQSRAALILISLALFVGMAGIITFLALDLAGEDVPASPGLVVDPPLALDDFALTSHEGEPIALSDLTGKFTLLYFGFVNCPDFCPITLTNFTRVQSALGAQADQVTFMMISVDGERDTPEVLDDYISGYSEDFIGMTGPEEEVRAAAGQFGVDFSYEPLEGSALGYTVVHSTRQFLLDPEGQLIRTYSYETDPAAIADELARLINTR
jgi:protein SCO1/2